ncbi:MAG TPA: FAD-dependent oxidoreductase [Ktedonobacteraceae bacterium]|nr:FAD-dependent oxidoreductase [Ktedonobacteraceae bacterium]
MQTQNYDAIVIGAGLGGLLSAAQLLQRGKRVLLVERLPHCGGRFTAKTFQGAQISTGAVHMLPFGSSGVLSRMLQRLKIPHRIFDAEVFGSFHVRDKQIRSRGILGVLKVFGPRQFFWFTRIGYLMFLKRLPEQERALPFDTWLARHINVQRNPELVAFFSSISRFALSLELHQVTAEEVIQTTQHMFRFGAPGILEGGCGALSQELEHNVLAQGAELRLRTEVLQILQHEGQVTGVRVRDKTNGKEELLMAPLVISDIGPRATFALQKNQQIKQADILKQQQAEQQRNNEQPEMPRQPEAIGLKVHVLSDVSFIPHKGILYCLDTQRIAGIVQPTNADPHLAPAGKHLLISHQVIRSENLEEEKALALADFRKLFGEETFDRHCRVLTMSAYRGEWPVNRLAQGTDVAATTEIQGLYLVGDAVKPAGYLMVEGVAQSVNQVLDLLDYSAKVPLEDLPDAPRSRPARNVVSPPPRLYALRWLWQAPGNS